jgi:hypothetical protein
MSCKCEDEDYLRKLIHEEIEKIRKVTPKANDLVALYFDNFPSDLVKPSGATVGAHIKLILKQLSVEQLSPLIPILAAAGKPITPSWLNWAKEQMQPKAKIGPATPSAPKFDRAEFDKPDAAPMPANFRDMVFKRVDDVLRDDGAENG